MAANNGSSKRSSSSSSSNAEKTERYGVTSIRSRNENHLVLSATYALNNSDTKRMQVGLRALSEDGAFVPVIKLCGNSSAGIYFDRDTWRKFRENMNLAGAYLRGRIKEAPNPVIVNDITVSFSTAYGARAIMVSHYPKKEEENSANDSPTKKRRTYLPSVVMQKTSFEGLENIEKCINARCEHLDSLASLVADCSRFLVSEIELQLPKHNVDEDAVKQTLINQYEDIEQNVRRQMRNLEFLDSYFEIVFCELTSIHFNEIARTIVMKAAS